MVRQDGIELLISKAITPYLAGVHMDIKKFLFMTRLKAQLEMRNGLVIATA